MQIVQTIFHPQGTRKVDVFRRSDGTFGFEEQHWLVDEECWCPTGKFSLSFIDTFEHALDEVKGRVSWVEKVL